MFTLFKNKTQNSEKFTEEDVRAQIQQRADAIAKERRNASKQTNPVVVATPTDVNPHAATIKKLDEILDKVSKFENSKITTLCELMIALESGNDKNLIEFLKKKEKPVVKIVKAKNY